MSLPETPDFMPTDWELPRESRREELIFKRYQDGTESYTSLIDDVIIDVKTYFPDGSSHYEWGQEEEVPIYHEQDPQV